MKKKFLFRTIMNILAVSMMILLVTGCEAADLKSTAGTKTGDNGQPDTRSLFAMDTYMTLTVYGEDGDEALDAAENTIIDLDRLLSTGDNESEIYKLNESGDMIMSDTSCYLFERAKEVNHMTSGAFNPMIYPLMEAWGFTDSDYHVPEKEEIASLLPLTDISEAEYDEETNEISFSLEGMKIDFGGIAKGYTSSVIMDIFRDLGIESAVISLGGNVETLGSKPDGSDWKIAIRDPDDETGYLGILETSDKAVITSGGYERFFEYEGNIYHHILDPDTGYPADSGLLSVTIVSCDGTLADALSTAVFVMGADEGTKLWRAYSDDFDMILLTDEGGLYITEGIKDCFTSSRYEISVITR